MLSACSKTCSECADVKLIEEFHKRAASPDGRQRLCKSCSKSKTLAYKRDHPESTRRGNQRDYEKHKSDRLLSRRQYVSQNREKVNAVSRKWAKENPAKANARGSRYRASRLSRTPVWADKEAIDRIYAKASRLSKWTGEDFHVDHIVPLNSELVCGLHCQHNLQILTAHDNTSKGNRHWPDS